MRTKFEKFSQMIQKRMRDALKAGHLNDPDTFRSCKRIIYNGVLECGMIKTQYCSIRKPNDMTITKFKEKYSITDEHGNNPEMLGLFAYAYPDRFLKDTPQSLKNFQELFKQASTTFLTSKKENKKMSGLSGKIENGIIVEEAAVWTKWKYERIGIDIMYHIKTGYPVRTKHLFENMIEGFTQFESDFWKGIIKFEMIHEQSLLEQHMNVA